MGFVMENKVLWVTLRELLGGDIGVANIYAPNIPKEWCFLWAEMVFEDFQGTACGYLLVIRTWWSKRWWFNLTIVASWISQMEKLMWEKLKEHFNVEDFFNAKNAWWSIHGTTTHVEMRLKY